MPGMPDTRGSMPEGDLRSMMDTLQKKLAFTGAKIEAQATEFKKVIEANKKDNEN